MSTLVLCWYWEIPVNPGQELLLLIRRLVGVGHVGYMLQLVCSLHALLNWLITMKVYLVCD